MDELTRRQLGTTFLRRENWEGDIHMIPQDDWFDHSEDVNCACNPQPDVENNKELKRGEAHSQLWIHNRIKDKEGCH